MSITGQTTAAENLGAAQETIVGGTTATTTAKCQQQTTAVQVSVTTQ